MTKLPISGLTTPTVTTHKRRARRRRTGMCIEHAEIRLQIEHPNVVVPGARDYLIVAYHHGHNGAVLAARQLGKLRKLPQIPDLDRVARRQIHVTAALVHAQVVDELRIIETLVDLPA